MSTFDEESTQKNAHLVSLYIQSKVNTFPPLYTKQQAIQLHVVKAQAVTHPFAYNDIFA